MPIPVSIVASDAYEVCKVQMRGVLEATCAAGNADSAFVFLQLLLVMRFAFVSLRADGAVVYAY